jgi:hypothetical protein
VENQQQGSFVVKLKMVKQSLSSAYSNLRIADTSSDTSSVGVTSGSQDHDDEYENEIKAVVAHKDYSTFQNDPPAQRQSPPLQKLGSQRSSSIAVTVMNPLCELFGGKSNRQCEDRVKNSHIIGATTWRIIILLSLLIAIIAYCRGDSYHYISPAWHFDYNVYIPRGDESDLQSTKRISLIAQVVSSRQLQSLAEVSSRPTRAYARALRHDYVRYDSGRGHINQRSCFDKIHVLNEIMDSQTSETYGSPSLWSHSALVQYDSIILLSPDSIVTELDTNIIDAMLPADKLAAIAGWNESMPIRSNSAIVVFNMKHKYASAVAKLWWEMVLPVEVTCGANNDLGLLLSAIAAVMGENDNLSELVQPLNESDNGFTGAHLIKSIVPPVPGCRAAYLEKSLQESRSILQETVDSVCYRFYPKCEVL